MKSSSRPALTKEIVDLFFKKGQVQGSRILWDGKITGLGLKVRSSGSASWVFVYRPRTGGAGEASRTMTLGTWPALDIAGARAAAMIAAGEIAKGGDPGKERVAARKRARWTVSAVADDYEADLKKRRFVNLKTRMASLREGMKPLMSKELSALTRADLVARIDARESRGLGSDDLRKAINGLYSFAIDRGLVIANPMAGVRRQRATRAEIIEDGESGRALSDDEIGRLWAASISMGSFGALFRAALLTGCRKNELAKLTWRDVDTDKITIHATIAKMGRTQIIPISPLMREIIAQQKLIRGTGGLDTYVFPSVKGNKTKISGWTALVERLRVAAGFTGKEKVDGKVVAGPKADDWFSIHDTRRTCRTIMSIEDVEEGLAELAVGHVTAALIRTYNKDTRESGIRDAFEKVSAHIAGIITAPEGEDGNVVSLGARRAGAGR
jgi:integrase